MPRAFTPTKTLAYPDARHQVKVGDVVDGMFVRIICEAKDCDHLVEIDAADFQSIGDPDTFIADLAPSFKCEECGHVGTPFWDAWLCPNNNFLGIL